MNPAGSKILKRPGGQVLAATLLFFSVFSVLFLLLYRSGGAHLLKERTVRGTDLTAVSCGAVYANGLQLVRYSNAVLMASAAFDLAQMVSAYLAAGGPASGPAAVAAAVAADPKTRERVQAVQETFFGVDRGGNTLRPGLYPLLICSEGYALASDNGLESRPPLRPLFLFNTETSSAARVLVPHMALRFRTADELLPDARNGPEREPLYRLRDASDGGWRLFRANQVEPAPGANAGQMRVRCDLPSPYRCKYVEAAVEGPDLPGIRWALKRLKDVLKRIRLDVTHRDDPPCHSLLVWGRHRDRLFDGKPVDQFSETALTGGGLAAWDIPRPKFKARLKAVEPERMPIIRGLLQGLPGGLAGGPL